MNKNKISAAKSNKQQGALHLLLLIFALICVYPIYAQQPLQTEPLEIGDPIPELILQNAINHPDSVIKSSDWNGKLVILSFWATWCKVCIEQLPKMDALQKEFGDNIMIIPVTQDSEDKVQRLLDSSPKLSGISLPFVTSTNLNHLFPHRLLPHEIWIGESGEVVGITGHEEINRNSIQEYFNKKVRVQEIKQDIINYDLKKPMIAGGLGNYILPTNKIRYSRMITSYIPGLGGFRSNVNKFEDLVTIKCTNTTIQDLYVQALATNPHAIWPQNNDFYLMFGGRLLWELQDSTLFLSPETRSRLDKTADSLMAFNYEIILPRSDSSRINALMLQDLNDYFGYHYNIVGSRQEREMDCWVLVCVDSSKLVSSTNRPKCVWIDNNANRIEVSNAFVDEFMFRWLSASVLMYFYPIPIINETGVTEPIELGLDVDPSDFEAVKKAISAYGLEFRREKRMIDMIVVQNKS